MLIIRALKSIAPHTATRLPITNDILLKIRPHMKLDTYEGKVMWAAFTFAHSCLMRCGEFTTRSYKDKNYMSINRLMQVNVEAPSEHVYSSSKVESINMCSTNRSALLHKV